MDHRLCGADTFEAVVDSAVGQCTKLLDDVARMQLRIDEMRCTETPCERFAGRIYIDADDHGGDGAADGAGNVEGYVAADPGDFLFFTLR